MNIDSERPITNVVELVPAVLVTILGAGTLAFGAVYPWAYQPLFAVAALIGLLGLWRGGIAPGMRPVAVGLLLVCVAAAAQLLPVPQSILETLSPSTPALASTYNLALSSPAIDRFPVSIDPGRTQTAVLALAALGLYLLGLPALLDGRSIRSLPRAIAIFAVPLALFAIYTREHHNNLIYGFWQPLDGNGSNQAGPFINRNHFGGFMVMALCVMVGWLLGQMERALAGNGARPPRPFAWMSSSNAGGILLMMTAVLIAAVSLFWTISRSAIMSFSLAAVMFAWLARRRRRLHTTRRSLVVVTLGAILLAGIVWRGPDVLLQWFRDERDLLSRLDAWRDGWTLVRDFPLFGTGLNTYSPAMLFYQQRNPGWHMAQAHNDYLQLLAEGGVFIAVPAAITAILLTRAIRRSLRAARGEARGYWVRAGAAVGLLAIGAQELVEFSLQIPVNAFLFCTLVAVALTPAEPHAGTVGTPPRDTIGLSEESTGAALS
jgi:O-antigen ligase